MSTGLRALITTHAISRVMSLARSAAISLTLLFFAAGARADERILSFDSVVMIKPDASLSVHETIHVRSEGSEIRRGIYRDFPTVYKDKTGRRVVTGFEIVSVERDGHSEPYKTERRDNGVRVYIGSEDVFLIAGEYVYDLRYRTDRQLGFFSEYDELYWNVTGNDWAFPLDAVSARVYLPESVPSQDIHLEAYTGLQGRRGDDYRAQLDDGTPTFTTTRSLIPHEGLTIVVNWPKGHVTPPSSNRYLLRDSFPAVVAGLGLLALLSYYIFIWIRVGRDPPGRIIVPQYEPPPKQSPAAMRFLTRMKYDDRCFAAGVLSLGVKGHLRVVEGKKGLFGLQREFTLFREKTPGARPPSADEALLLERLFSAGDQLELKNANHEIISSARTAQRVSLRDDYNPNFFRINGGWHALGILLSLVVAVLAILVPATRNFPLPWFFTTGAGLFALLAVLIGLVANGVFGRLLKAPTIAGRAVMDHIEGYRLYLDVAEGEELKLQGAPALTTQLFETHLPAALALGVEQNWAERFATVFATRGASASPAWYHGDSWSSAKLGSFTSNLGSSLDGAISSSAQAPGSSSGSGGGGSSGGGGGGGGGGGW